MKATPFWVSSTNIIPLLQQPKSYLSLGPIAEALRQSYDLPYNQPTAPEHFREQVHLKPGPPYHEKQEANDFMDHNVWHAVALTEPTIVGNPISTEPHLPQQQLEPEIAIQQQHYPGLAPNLEVSHLPKEIDSTILKNPILKLHFVESTTLVI